MLLLAAGWTIFQWILAVITLDEAPYPRSQPAARY
jgi:hypothetical protein